MGRCECEHESHMGEDSTSTAHRYGAEVEGVGPLKTVMGTFQTCPACVEAGHMTEPYD